MSSTRRARVRPLVQLGLADCGPACLRMVLGYFGRHVSVRELNPELVSPRDGVTAAWLIACAERQGLRAEGFEVSVEQLPALPAPAILHTTWSHFVVFEGLDGDHIVIVDPSVGERWRLSEEEARDLLAGTAIAFEPTARLRRRSRVRLALETLAPLLPLDPRTSVLVAAIVVGLGAMSVAIGSDWLWSLVAGASPARLPALAPIDRLAIAVVALTTCAVALLRAVDASVRAHVDARLTRLANVRVTVATFPEVSALVLVVAALVGAVVTAWETGASIAILLVAFAASLVMPWIGAVVPPSAAARSERRSSLRENLVWCARVIVFLAIWLGAYHLDRSLPGIDGGASFADVARRILPHLLLAVATFRLGGFVAMGRMWFASYERVRDSAPNESFRPGGDVQASSYIAALTDPTPQAPLLQVRGIVLDLGDTRDRLLSELEFEVNEGDHVAIIGPVGSGKTTLIRAILGRLDPSPDSILFHGHSLRAYESPMRTQLVDGMAQGDRVPDSKISRLLRIGEREASRSEMRDICTHLGFDEEFSRLPLGYNTPVARDADTLSRGQRQMLMLARAVASGARILALDDPLDALDDAMARRVLEGLATLPSAVVVTMTNECALSDLDFKVIRLGDLAQTGVD